MPALRKPVCVNFAVSRLPAKSSASSSSLKIFHTAVGVVDDEPFLRPKQLMGDHEGTNSVLACPTTGVADDVRVALGEAGELRRIEASVHAGEYEKPARWRQCEPRLFTERRRISDVCLDDFVLDSAHLSNPILS